MGLQVPHVAATATFWQVVEKDVMALMVVLQHLKLCLPLPHPLAFFLLLFSLQVSGTVGSLLGSFFFLFFFSCSCLSCCGQFHSLDHCWGASRCFLTSGSADLSGMRIFLDGVCSPCLGGILSGSILLGSILHRGTLGWHALRRCILG